ncbi:MAG: hypothetical protein AABY46_07650 [Nitrospirota bacterium]
MRLWKLLRRGRWFICWTSDDKTFTALDVENFEVATAGSYSEAFDKIAGNEPDEDKESKDDLPSREKSKKSSGKPKSGG